MLMILNTREIVVEGSARGVYAAASAPSKGCTRRNGSINP